LLLTLSITFLERTDKEGEMSLKLVEYAEIKKKLVCKTGLHIGGSKDDIEIGGLDNPVIRDPLTRLPYIPGSSLKGKLRSILEYKEGKVSEKGEPHGCGDPKCLICTIFGAHGTVKREIGPTRILVRDALLTDESKKKLQEGLESGSLYTGLKQEVSIDRKTGKASQAGPRTTEFVPAGTEFELNIILRTFESDNKDELVEFVKKGLDLLQKDYLGGSGTRGYGWVEILDLQVSDA
jgi:CRISPR-associated protein Csm3